eukprot:Platyproteum_vivax@DN6821_c0_g1_i1.p1
MMLHLTYLCVVSFVIYGAFCNESCDLNSPFSILTCPNGGGGILLQGGTVVNEASMEQADVWVCGEVVERVQKHMKIPAGAEVIDVTNKYVLPGGIDPHTHLDMPFMGTRTCDDFYSGHKAALAGGTTMHIDFVLPVNNSLLEGYEAWRAKSKRAAMDYAFHMAITTWNRSVEHEMTLLTTKKGINSFKFFMAYKGALMVNDEQLLEGFRQVKKLGALAQVHAENGDAVFLGQEAVFKEGITGPWGHALS